MSKRRKLKAQKSRRYPKLISKTVDTMLIKGIGIEHEINYKMPNDETVDAYIYFVFHNLELIYIGKGSGDRWKHTISKNSQNAFIRKAVKSESELHKNGSLPPSRYQTVIVKDGQEHGQALALEQMYISWFKPIGNVDKNPMYQQTKKGIARLASNIITHGDISKTANRYRIAKKSIISSTNRRKQWYLDHEEQFASENLDRDHLKSLIQRGLY